MNDLQCDIHDRPDGRLADRGRAGPRYVTVVPEKLMWGMCWWVPCTSWMTMRTSTATTSRKPALELN